MIFRANNHFQNSDYLYRNDFKMDKEIEQLKVREENRRTMELLNMLELYLNFGSLFLKIMRNKLEK